MITTHEDAITQAGLHALSDEDLTDTVDEILTDLGEVARYPTAHGRDIKLIALDAATLIRHLA